MAISKEVKVGIITTVAIGCFIYGFSFLKGRNLFSNQKTVYALYKNIDGLVQGNPVIANGLKVGIVGDIYLWQNPDNKKSNTQSSLAKQTNNDSLKISLLQDTTSRVVVTLLLDENVQVTSSTIAKIVSSDLLGSKAVELILGVGNAYVENGDTLQSAQEDNLKTAVNKTIAPLQKKAESLISSIDSVMVVVQEVFNENARQNLTKSFENIKLAITSLTTTSYRLDTLVFSEKAKISSILTKINVLANTLAQNSDKLSNAINNFSNISDSIAKSNLKSAINNAEVVLSQTSSIMTKINSGQGTLGMLVNSDSLYRKLDKSSEDLDKLLKDLRINPERYVHISVFGRKDRNKPKE